MAYTLAQIAHIETDFSEKFGIPRQSGLVEELRARIVFEPEFRSPDAVRGLDGYDYIWLVWQFSTVVQAGQDGTNWRPTVRPPRLGGNTRMGVFATRSPFRPNALGLSSVKLLKVEHEIRPSDIFFGRTNVFPKENEEPVRTLFSLCDIVFYYFIHFFQTFFLSSLS